MNRLLLTISAICAAALGAGAWHQQVKENRAATVLKDEQWRSGTNHLAALQAAATSLRNEILEKKHRLLQATAQTELSPELLGLLEGGLSQGSAAAWLELRQRLGIHWDSSPDYVLVNKRVIRKLDYSRLNANNRVTGTACELLSISPNERAALDAVLQSNLNLSFRVELAHPAGDVVAEYEVSPPDPSSEQAVSNSFVSGLAQALGSDRTSLLLPAIWREFKSHTGPAEPETITVRRALVDDAPDLVWELRRGGNLISTAPVRYAHYPAWFLEIFSGGWQTLADREGFELPAKFMDGTTSQR